MIVFCFAYRFYRSSVTKAGVLRMSYLVVVVLCFRKLIETRSVVPSNAAMWRPMARG